MENSPGFENSLDRRATELRIIDENYRIETCRIKVGVHPSIFKLIRR